MKNIILLITDTFRYDNLGARAKRPVRLPLVLSHDEVAAVLRHLYGPTWIMASLLYGAGLRLMECLRLRVKDVDFKRGEITVRSGKGMKDRVTMLPKGLRGALAAHCDVSNSVGPTQALS